MDDKKKSPLEVLKSSNLFSEDIDGFVFGATLKDGQVGMMVNGKFDITDRLMMITTFFQAMLGVDFPRWPMKLPNELHQMKYLDFLRQAVGMVAELLNNKEKFTEFMKNKDEEKKVETNDGGKKDA